MSRRFRVAKAGPLRGALLMPGDKSISHRALMLGALSENAAEIHGLLQSADVLATLEALRRLGVAIDEPLDGCCGIDGVGLRGLAAPTGDLDLGNSGTAMRLLSGILSGQAFASRLVGDASLSRRPMARIVEPLRRMGACMDAEDGHPPLSIRPTESGLRGIDYETPMASAQVKSCVLLAGLYAAGDTRLREPMPSRDHTERMLRAFGYPIELSEGWWRVVGPRPLVAPARLKIPGDVSSAAFWLVAASIIPGSDLELVNVGINPLRAGILGILRAMGARIERLSVSEVGGEPVARLRVRASRLRAARIEPHQVPAAIDEFPAIFAAAAFAEGETVIGGAAELRAKESDRIAVMVTALQAMGIEARETADGAIIRGRSPRWQEAEVDAAGDHRCAMALAIAAAAGAGGLVKDVENVQTSYPRFLDHAQAVDMPITEEQE